jgi:hypothetical protein
MKRMATLDRQVLITGDIFEEVIGSCRDCDFDATWSRYIKLNTVVPIEDNLQQYFFG